MATYRLVWSGDGALDLSQVLDTRGRPIVLSPQQRAVSVKDEALKNSHIQRYLATPYLTAELLDGPKPVVSPPAAASPPSPPKATPVANTARAASVSPPAPPVPPAPLASSATTAPAATSPVMRTVVVSDPVVTKETLTVTASSAEPPSPSTPPSDTEAGTESKGGFKGRKGGRK